MDTTLTNFERVIARSLVKSAAGGCITCPRCKQLLDAPATVLLCDETHTVVLCALCYGRPVGNLKAGAVTVYDGRDLFVTKSKTTWRTAA